MKKKGEIFSALLTEAIREVKRLESKPIGIIQDELGHAIGKKNGSLVEYWRKGNLPARVADFEGVTRKLIQRTGFELPWLKDLCASVDYPFTRKLCDELFGSEDGIEEAEEGGSLREEKRPFHLPQTLPQATALPQGSIMPLARNRFFVGRTHNLQRLAQIFNRSNLASVGQGAIATASGLGGVGKTQLACEFVHRYGQFFAGGVFWLSFEEPEAIPSQIAKCGGAAGLNLSEHFHELGLDDQVRLVTGAWQQDIPRLLVFDNCEDEALLEQWRPVTGGCRILITSRRNQWDPIFGIEQILLTSLFRHESVALLRKLSREEGNEDVFDLIAKEVGDLPLALHLAGRYLYLHRRSLTPQEYLDQLTQPDLIDHPSFKMSGVSPTGHVQHVAKTFSLSFNQLKMEDPIDALAHAILVRAAHFAPGEPIWFELLVKMVQYQSFPPPSKIDVDQAISRLLDLGLLEDDDQATFRMHRLIAAFVRHNARDAIEATIEAVENVVFDETARVNEAGHPVPLLSWHLHLRYVTDAAQMRENLRGAQLCHAMGVHLMQIGEFAKAIAYFERALDICKKLDEENTLFLAETNHYLGRTYREIDNLTEAMRYLSEAQTMRESALGVERVETAHTYNEIARCYLQQGETSVAYDFLEKAYQIAQQSVGEQNKFTAEFANNLGIVAARLNGYEDGLALIENALRIRLEILGEHHPMTALSYNNMGYIYRGLGKFEEALPYYERALQTRETIFGEKHPSTAETLNNLGNLLRKTKQFDAARGYLQRSLAAYEAVFDPEHQDIAFPLYNLGCVLASQGSYFQAKDKLERAFKIRQRAYGDEHSLTIKVKEKLAAIRPGPR